MHDAMQPAMIRRFLVLSMWTAVAMILCSFSKSDIRTMPGPIAARVNGKEIGNGKETPAGHVESARAPNIKPTPAPAGRPAAPVQVRTVDQDLLAQEAIQGKLDGDAQVAQAIERAKRQVLAQAYIERTVSSASPASPQEIGRFYARNPALFEQRRLYRVVELEVVVAPDQLGALRDAVAGAKNLAAVVTWLESRKLPFELAIQNRASEQVPMNVLRRLVEMHGGQIAVFPTPGGASVIRLENSAPAPLSEKQARPAIARYLLNRKRLELAQAEVTKLRERAKTDSGGIEAVRPASVTQTAARAQSQVAGPGIAFNTIDLVKVR